jgi:hypothetical protein
LLHATATAPARSVGSGGGGSSTPLLLSADATAALLHRAAELLRASKRGCPNDVGNLVSAAAALAEAGVGGDGHSPIFAASLSGPLASLAHAALAWEGSRPLPDAEMTALGLAKLTGGLSRLLGTDEAAMATAAPRWLARARALLPDARIRAVATVAGALAVASRRRANGEHGEAVRAFVADARRRLPVLVAAAASHAAVMDLGEQDWDPEARSVVQAALTALEAAAAEEW